MTLMGRGNKAPKVMPAGKKVPTAAELESKGDWGSPDFGQKTEAGTADMSATKK
jgi:hypothetical protein